MKKIIPVLLFFLIIFSCEKERGYTKMFCWECHSMVYGREIVDKPCFGDPYKVYQYEKRLLEFYEGEMTSIECKMLPDSISETITM